MKTSKTVISSIALTTLLAVQPALAKEEQSHAETAKQTLTITSLTIAGAAAAGPIGALAGFLGGAFLDKSADKKNEQISQASQEIDSLNMLVDNQSNHIQQLEKGLAAKLEFQVMFATGKDAVSEGDLNKLEKLAIYLKENTFLNVRLDGHADPRGTEEYNNVLSAVRAKNVAEHLENFGIDPSRIELHAHGESLSEPNPANIDQYSFSRRVDIEVFASNTNEELVSAHP